MNRSLKKKLARFLEETDGPTTVEYAIMLAFIVLGCMFSITMLGNRTGDVFTDTADKIEAQATKGG